jgi:alanyl-tRNA synthetase
MIEQPGTVALLGLAGEKIQLIMARSADWPELDMVALLRGTMAALAGGEGGRGGGRPDFAQGGGGPADMARLQAALDAAANRLGGA